MTWRLLICFSACLQACLAAISATGRVTLVEGKHGHSQAVNPAGIVIWLEPRAGSHEVHGGRFTMLQKNKTFTPHVLAIPVGSRVDFPNADPIFHNAFSNYDGQFFDIGLYPPGSSRSVTFSRAGVVRIFCNIHASMSAVIVVTPTPYFAISGRDGRFNIADVPAGSYRLSLYAEQASEKTLREQSRDIEITEALIDLGEIALTRSPYLNIPHLNKYGKEYRPDTNSPTYPGAKP